MMITRPTLEDINAYLKKTGKKGSLALSILGKQEPFVQALQSEVGFEILKDDVQRLDEIMVKIYNENATPQELAEFRYLKLRLTKMKDRINTYIDKLTEVKSAVG